VINAITVNSPKWFTAGVTPSVRIACCQTAPDVDHPDANPVVVREALAAAIRASAQIVILPGLSNSGYVFRDLDEVQAAAISREDERLREWSQEARRGNAIVIGGCCERAPDGRIYNSSGLVDGDGVVAVYRKLHLWDEEARWFSPGGDPAPVVDTRFGRIGLAVLRHRIPGADAGTGASGG
jgi:predicted amidohydrolase